MMKNVKCQDTKGDMIQQVDMEAKDPEHVVTRVPKRFYATLLNAVLHLGQIV